MVATNYPAFNWVNTHNATYAAQLGGSHLQWYMPSIAELCEVYKNRAVINASMKAIHDLPNGNTYTDEVFKTDTYWSSSQDFYRSDDAYDVVFTYGTITSDHKFLDLRVCCIADF